LHAVSWKRLPAPSSNEEGPLIADGAYRSHKGDVKRGLGTVVYLRVGCNNSALNITNVWDDTVQIGRNVAKFRMNLP